MKVNDPGEAGSPRVLGKEFLIVIVVICSAISFTLGYFVGLGRRENKPPAPPTVAEPAQVPLSAVAQPGKTEAPPTPPAQQADRSPEKTQSLAPKPQDADVRVASPDSGAPRQAPGRKTATAGKEAPAPTAKEAPDKTAGSEKDAVYTVQLGALKNPAEARRMKERLVKKGFKATILVAKSEKGAKIYKIRTGEFSNRKEAEVLVLRLKKTEGLKAFVTPKNE